MSPKLTGGWGACLVHVLIDWQVGCSSGSTSKVCKGHLTSRPPALRHHEAEQFSKAEEAGLGHGGEWLKDLLLHVQRVHPESDAALKMAHVGVHGAPVSDVVTGVGMSRAQDALPHKKSLNI